MVDRLIRRTGAPSLVGRTREMNALTAFVASLQRGRGGALIARGVAGIGKSRLLAEAALVAQREGVRVAAGRADEAEALVPMAPLLGALSSGPSPVLARAQLRALERPGDQRFWLAEELAELLEIASRDMPLLVMIDDLQWADPSTIWAVHYLSERLASSALGWLFAVRADAAAPALAGLVAQLVTSGAAVLEVEPLAATDVEMLTVEVTSGTPDPELRMFLDDVGGNPFLALHLLQALIADDAIRVDRGTASLAVRAVPDRFRASVRWRLRSLSPDAVQFLRAASVFGRSFRIADVAAVLGTQPGAVVPLVDETIRADVLFDVDGRLEFRHDLLRQAISADIPASARATLHRAAAGVIVARNGPATEAATHLLESATSGDREAVDVLRRAADDVAGQAPRTAAELALRAVALTAPDDPSWTTAVAATVRLAAWGSRFSDATALAARALTMDLDGDADGAIRLGLSDALMLGGRRRDVITQCREALARPDLPARLRCNFLHNLGFALAMDGEVSAAASAYREGIACAGPLDEGVVLACRIGLGFVAGSQGDFTQALTIAQECAETAARGGAELRQRFPQAWLAQALTTLDRFAEADDVRAAYRKEAETFGASWALEFCERGACARHMVAGNLGDAGLQAEATLALIEAFDMWHDADVPLGVLAIVAVHRNDLEVAKSYLSRAAQRRTSYARGLPAYLTRAEALVRDATGDSVGAIESLREIFDQPELLTQNLALEPTFAPELVRLALRAHDDERAAVVTSASEALAQRNAGLGSFDAAAAHCRGLATGELDALVDAAKQFSGSPRVLARASAYESAGRALVDRGDVAAGAPWLTEAVVLLHDAGALRDEARVSRCLRNAGIRPQGRRAGPDERPSVGWDAVTSAELRVVRLVARGMTNRQVAERLYLSTYTVATHLRHVFEKVGVASRVELARSAVERGVAT